MSETLRQEMYKSFVREVITEKSKRSCSASCKKSAVEDKTDLVGAGRKRTLSELRDVFKYERALKGQQQSEEILSSHVLQLFQLLEKDGLTTLLKLLVKYTDCRERGKPQVFGDYIQVFSAA